MISGKRHLTVNTLVRVMLKCFKSDAKKTSLNRRIYCSLSACVNAKNLALQKAHGDHNER